MAIEFALIPPPNPKILLAPDLPKLIEISRGNLGIADSMKKATVLANLRTSTDIETLKTYMSLSKVQLNGPVDDYIKDGKLRIPESQLNFEGAADYNGLKALEITTFKSIFETKKPYMDVIAIVVKSLVDIEDLIARVLAIADSSLKPATNPVALGYLSKAFKKDSNILKNLGNKEKQNKTKKDTNYFDDDFLTNPRKPEGSDSTTYEIVGTEYSTGSFDPTVNYDYSYHDIESNQVVIDDEVEQSVDFIERPGIMAFNILDSKGEQIQTPDWLLNSGKWYGQFPQLGSYWFLWTKDGNTLNIPVGFGVDESIYGGGWTNTEIRVFNQNDIKYYRDYYNYLIEFKLARRPKLKEEDKNDIRVKINNKLDINSQLNGVSSGGFIYDFNPPIFKQKDFRSPNPNRSTLPKQVSFSGSNVYVDPETEYDLKLIKVDSTLDIAFFEQNDKRVETRIQRFLFNTLRLSMDDNTPFDGFISTNDFGLTAGLSNSNVTSNSTDILNTNEIVLDNLTSNFQYSIDILRKENPAFFRPIFWNSTNQASFFLDTPNFGVEAPLQGTQSQVSQPSQPSQILSATEYRYIFKDNISGKWRYNIKNTSGVFVVTSDYLNNYYDSKPIADGTYSIPNSFGNVLVKNGYIDSWLLPRIGFSVADLQNKSIVIDSSTQFYNTVETTVALESGSIRVSSDDDRFGKIINSRQIRNDQLQIPDPYSTQEYGNTQIQQIFRYRTSLDDTDTWYILEGKLQTEETEVPSSAGGSNANNFTPNKKYYRKPHALGAPKKFIDVFMGILVDLIPSIKDYIELILNPQNFIADTLKDKLGENFEIFSADIIERFQKLSYMNPKDRFQFVEDYPDLKKYVSVDRNTGEYIHILDGQAITEFLNIRFGLELKKLNIFLIFERLNNVNNPPANTESNSTTSTSNNMSNFNNGNTTGTEIRTTTDENGQTITEEISVVYSTGTKKDNIDYEYIYLNETVVKILEEYDAAFKNEDYELALTKLLEASTYDKDNKFIRKKLDELRKKVNKYTQPILDFLLALITTPIKVVFEIIKYIKGIFENISIPTVVDTFKEFITFKWLKQFLSKDFLLGLLGIKLDFAKLRDWRKNVDSFPDDRMFDLSEIFSAPFFLKLPTVPKNHLQYMLKQICETMNALLKLIEGILNGFIDFIWSLISLDVIIPQPYISLTNPCADSNQSNLSTDELFNLLNGINPNSGTSGNVGSEEFAFDIKTSDGRNIRELDRDELEEFLRNNKNLDFKFDF